MQRHRVGEVARDVRTDRIGVVMAVVGGRTYLRPLGGGREWETAADDVVPVPPHEELSARLAVANARSRSERR
ncbi:hypothetical protein NGB36_29645 [Streptomyces sp. RB6PN25]|uniref:Uncharacterized protein n=1 Tax=Streptomyces humicola TaxID=2953240 RepID=A0ABT1Q3Y4_9ACTN|nr:hypothetical protein [Streptomyces humicola]MCQ4084628.1 hypothetical protein [Streptomyces humicola]